MRDALFRTWALVVKELLQLRRDRLLLAFLILGPMLELTLMGGLTGGGIKNLPLAVVDLDRSRASRELIARLSQQDELLIQVYGDDVAQAQAWMQEGQISVIVVVPPGYGNALLDPFQSAEVQVIADGSNQVVSSVAAATAEKAAAEVIRDVGARYGDGGGGLVDLRFVARFNAALSGRPHSLTAILGLIVYQVTLLIASQSFTRERELGTMEQLRVTPLGRVELMAGKAIPTLLVGVVDCLLMTGVVIAWFDIPMRGSVWLLLFGTVPFLLVQIGWGTLISLVSHTQQQSILFVFALAMLEVALSGFMVPANNLPGVMRVLSYVSSVRHYTEVLRGVMLRGAGIGVLWTPSLALGGIALAVMALAWIRLRLGLETSR
jgi:ABC-2 type transport system permease protein